MKTSSTIVVLMALAGLSTATSVFGQSVSSFHYLENSPMSASGDAAAEAFEVGGQLSFEELVNEFGSDTTSAAEPAPAGGAGNLAGAQASANGTRNQAGVEVSAGHYEVQGQHTDFYTIRIPYSRRLSERAVLEMSIPLTYAFYDKALWTDDADAYGIGFNAGYAWQAFLKKDNVPYRWKITPSVGVHYRDSEDMNAGAWVFSTGLSSSFAWQFAPGWVINLGNSASFAWHTGIKDYPDPIRDDQQTLKNGVQLYRMMDRWTVWGYVTHTQALNDMIVDSYRTYGLSAGYKLTKTRSLKASIYFEEGNGDYRSVRGTLGSTWQF